jgi:hypothetical protein
MGCHCPRLNQCQRQTLRARPESRMRAISDEMATDAVEMAEQIVMINGCS